MTIFDFLDYKAFLRETIRLRPAKGRGEVNRIGEALDVHPTLVSQVLRGPKDFSLEQSHRLASYLGLTSIETDYLLALVLKERAGTKALREYYQQKLTEMKKQSLSVAVRIKEHRELTDTERSRFYSNWIYSAVRLFTSLGKGKNLDDVAFRFRLSRARTRLILDFLVQTGLCVEHRGVFTLGSQHTHLAAGSPDLTRHHANWRMKALERSDRLTDEELMFTSPFSVGAADFKKIRAQLLELIRESAVVIRDSPAEQVACLNIDLFFPLGDGE